jgi:hypothetical protein
MRHDEATDARGSEGRSPAAVGVVVGVVLGLLLSGCASGAGTVTSHAADHATVEPVAGSDVSRLVLSSRALERLDIRTAVARRASGGQAVIPYAAVIYSADGQTWAYTVAGRTGFQRRPVAIEHIAGDEAVLSAGLRPGTRVVVRGAAELLGTELDVGH